MRSRRQALPTRRAPHPRERRKRRRGTILLVLCCYALSTACLALGYALGDWRLVAGGVAGLGVERARPGARPAALLVHGSAYRPAPSQASQHGPQCSLAGSQPSSTAPTAPGSPLGLLTSGTTQRRSPTRAHVRDLARSVRDSRYLYIRNYMPHLGYNQPTVWPYSGEIRHEFYRLTDSKKNDPCSMAFLRSHTAR